MNFKQLEYFSAVAEAKKHFPGLPGSSMWPSRPSAGQIALLEDELGGVPVSAQ